MTDKLEFTVKKHSVDVEELIINEKTKLNMNAKHIIYLLF